MDSILNNLRNNTKNPESFLKTSTRKQEADLKDLLHRMYKVATSSDVENKKSLELLPELVLDDMDEEQIWQQLDLRNGIVFEQYMQQTSSILALHEQKLEIKLNEHENSSRSAPDINDVPEEFEESMEDGDDEDGEETNDSDDEDGNELTESEDDEKRPHQKRGEKKGRPSVVDDKFFKLHEMEKFLEAEDNKELRKNSNRANKDDSGVDYFAEQESDDEENQINYGDFYASDEDDAAAEVRNEKVKKKSVQLPDKDEQEENNMSDSESEADSDSQGDTQQLEEKEIKSTFELRQERLQKRIHDYENEVLGEKPWQLKGEALALHRPQNSLLEEVLEFESMVRPAPVITESTTRCLEDIIRQRIKDQSWDDVELKVRPTMAPQDFRKQIILNQEKSKESLAQIYEKEYQREVSKLTPGAGDTDGDDKNAKEHDAVRRSMRALFDKLDTLFHFHFTPKPVAVEPKIITNTPALQMEEALPTAVSDAHVLAPEEVYRASKKSLLGKSEHTATDKNRERRQKKQKQRAIHKASAAKDVQRQKLGIPLSQKAEKTKLLKKITKHRNVQEISTSNDHKSIKSSKQFFSRLQDANKPSANTTKSAKTVRKPKAEITGISAKKFKL